MSLSARFDELIGQAGRLLRVLEVLGRNSLHLDTSTRKLQELLTESVRTLRSRMLETRDDPYTASLSGLDGEEQLLPDASILSQLHLAMRWVERVGFHAMPPERVPALRSALRPLAPEAHVVFQSRRELTFSTFPIRELLAELSETSPPPSLYVVRVPISEKEHVLFDPLFGHEFGHITWWERKVADSLKHLIAPDQSVIEDAAELFAIKAADLRRSVRATGLAWLEELFCEITGVYLYGYAYLCAFVRFMHIGEAVDCHARENQEHPPLRLRFRFIRLAIDRFNATPMDDGVEVVLAKELRDWEQYHAAVKAPPPKFAAHSVLFTIFEDRAVDIIDEAWRLLTSWDGPRTYARDDVAAGFKLLERLVPPFALPTAQDWQPRPFDDASVLAAGWAFRLAGYPSWQRMGWDVDLCATKLDGLLERAIESGELLRRRGEG